MTTTQRIDPWRGMKLLPTQQAFVRSKAKYRLYSSGYGGGKDLDPSTPIPSPAGWRRLGDLAVGDEVFDEMGKPCRVTGTIETEPKRCYRVTLRPLLIYGVMLWGVGLSGGYWLAYVGGQIGPWQVSAQDSPLSFWIAATAALAVVALCFVWLLHRAVERSRHGNPAL